MVTDFNCPAVCVEAGTVAGWQKLDPGDAFEGGQTIKVIF